jgi:hypothetical protein
VGLVTFDRALQSGIEDFGYAQRKARLRGHYFQHAPEPVDYLLSVPPAQRLQIQGMHGGRWQRFLTVAGMVGVITAVLTRPAAGLLAAIATDHSLVAALGVGAGSPSPPWPGRCVSSGQHGNGSARRHRSPTCKQPESGVHRREQKIGSHLLNSMLQVRVLPGPPTSIAEGQRNRGRTRKGRRPRPRRCTALDDTNNARGQAPLAVTSLRPRLAC